MIRFFGRKDTEEEHPTTTPSCPLYLYNTASKEKELFEPRERRSVSLYSCGPTVYDYQHIGNMRAALFSDTVKRVLVLNGYSVRHVINITDFGHLTSDADEGEDKMMIALKRRELPITMENMLNIATEYMERYFEDLEALNVRVKHITFPRASEHVPGMVAIIKSLEEKGYAYELEDGVYFDISRYPEYGSLGGINIDELKAGARMEVHAGKRSPFDFALWKKNSELGWDSPWGKGFPGWHIECTAMIFATLGRQIDIHTGGIDHIAVHHNNEKAQAESATGKQYVRYWMHNAHLKIENSKISKSLGNGILVRQISDRGYSPIALRYLFLTGHYRTPMNFTWESLEGASAALTKVQKYFLEELPQRGGVPDVKYHERLLLAVNNDLDTPKVIALLFELIKDEAVSKTDKRATMLLFDKVLGLGLNEGRKKLQAMLSVQVVSMKELPDGIVRLVEAREEARKNKNWAAADEYREEITRAGYDIQDSDEGPTLKKKEE